MTCHLLESKIANYIDDLLVAAKIEHPRNNKFKTYVANDFYGTYSTYLRAPARVVVDINFAYTYAVIKYNSSECWFNLQSGRVVFDKMLTPFFRKIAPFVKKAILQHQDELKEEYKNYLDLRTWKTVRYTNSDDQDYKFNRNISSDGYSNTSVVNTSQYKDLFDITLNCSMEAYGIKNR